MATRVYNALTTTQRDFGKERDTDFGGWTATGSSTPNLLRFMDETLFNRYVVGEEYKSTYTGNVLAVYSTGTSDITTYSPFFDVVGGDTYLTSIWAFVNYPSDVVISMDFYDSPSSTPVSASNPRTRAITARGAGGALFARFTAPNTASIAKIKITYSGTAAGNLTTSDSMYLYDPVVCNDELANIGNLSAKGYEDLPDFMKLDDSKITDLVSNQDLSFPLKRFVQALYSPADTITSEAKNFEYTRPTEGTESKSKLTDPDTAASSYLAWLASITGTQLVVSSSGFSPWTALEDYEGDPVSGDPGEWEDLETLDWLGIEGINPDFFDTVQSFRDQIRTGFTGINSGRPDTIEEFVKTMLSDATKSVTVTANHRDNPFKVEILVDPAADPDASGSLIADAVNQSMSAGATVSKVGQVADSGKGSFDFSKLVYPATVSNSGAAGAVVYGQSFVSDEDGFARHLRLNENSSTTIPEIGGGVADSHYTTGSSYVYGDMSSSTYGSLTTAKNSLANLGGVTTGYEIIVVLSDLTLPTVSVDTSGSGGNTPADWLYREKRLIACGTDDGGSDNDWALYLVSGATPAADTETRLLLVDGYEAVGANNYAVSSAIDFNALSANGDVVLRVSKAAGSGAQTVSFFAQSSLYDDWANNAVGTASITSDSQTAGSDAEIQILGKLNATDNWADANPLSCEVKRFMLFNAPITFSGTSDTSSGNHAYIDGEGTTNYGYFLYSPTIDIDLSGVSVYATSFSTAVPSASPITVTVNKAASNDLDVLAMRHTGSDMWYFGHAASGGDTLTINGLSNSTAYDVVTRVVNTTTGGASNKTNSITTNGSGVLTLTPAIVYEASTSNTFSGLTLNQIAIQPNGGGSNVAKFLPTTIGTGATTGADSVDASHTWTLTRNFPGSVSTAYAPSQLIDKSQLHVYEGAPTLNNCPEVEVHTPFSVFIQCRRFWTASSGTTYDIFRLENASGHGLRLYYDGPAIKATFTDGTNTETVTWTESPTYGSWQEVVVRRDASNGLSLVINGTEVNTATASVTLLLATPTTVAKLGQGSANQFTARFGISDFAFFDRRLSNTEITLLGTQIT